MQIYANELKCHLLIYNTYGTPYSKRLILKNKNIKEIYSNYI